MARFLLRWPIGLLFCFATVVGQAFGLLRLEPTTVYKDFGQKLAFNQTFVAAADGEALAVCTNLVFPHDRLPFPGSQAKCDGKSMQILALFEMEEAYVIGCCAPVENHTGLFRCPVPPLHDANPLLALVSNDLRPVHYAVDDGEWHRGEQAIEYAHENRLDGVIRATTTLFAVAFAVGCGIAVVASHVHEWANKYPWAFVAFHVTATLLFVATMVALFIDVPGDAPLRASVVHLALQAAFSALLVYTPADGYYAEDQRLPVRHGCGDIVRHTAANCFLLSALFNAFSVHAVAHMVWSRFEAPFDVLFFFLLVSMLTLCTFCVAFTTSLYGVHEPLRIGDGTVVLGDAYAKVASEASRRLFYDYETKRWGAQAPALGPGTVVAMDAALRGWVVGTFDEGRLHLSEHALCGVVQGVCSSRLRCRLPDHDDAEEVALYCVDDCRCFVRFGKVRVDGQVRIFHTGLYSILERVLRLQRTFGDDGYELNVVETLRRACHRKFASRAYVLAYAALGGLIVSGGAAWPVYGALVHGSQWFLFAPPVALVGAVLVALHHAVFTDEKRLAQRSSGRKRGSLGIVECVLGEPFPEQLGPYDEVSVRLLPGEGTSNPTVLHIGNTPVPFTVPCHRDHETRLIRTTGPAWVCDVCSAVLLDETVVFYCAACNWCACCHPPIDLRADEATVHVLGQRVPFEGSWTFRIS